MLDRFAFEGMVELITVGSINALLPKRVNISVKTALSGKILQLCGQLQQPFGQFAESLLARPPAQIRLDFLA